MTDEKLDQVLRQALAPKIDDIEIQVDKRRKDEMRRFDRIKKGVAAAAAVAVVFVGIVGIVGIGYFNPVLAAKIPLIGRIFERIEEKVVYSGDYTEKSSVLTKEDVTGNLDTFEYSVSDKGVTLTASEVYCDGYSVFAAVKIEANDADFTHIPKHYTGMYIEEQQLAAGFYIDGTWSADENSWERLENSFEGEVIDSHIFAGMLKINFAEKLEGSGQLSLKITGLGYDDDRMLDSEDISASHWIEGNWNLDIPFEVNEADVKRIEVGEKRGEITLEDVVISPYQVIVHTETPGKQRELTDDRREKLLSKDPDLTDEQMFEILGWSYQPCQTIVFNQDGEMLYSDMEMAGRAGFAVQGKEIQMLYVFIFDNLEDWCQMKEEGMESSVADKAVIAKEIYVE